MLHKTYQFEVSTPCPAKHQVSVYEQAEGERKFSIGLPLELVPAEHLGGVFIKKGADNPGDMLSVKSRYAPEVIPACGDVDRLAEVLKRCEARNLGRDHVFHGRELLVSVERRLFSPRDDRLFNSYDDRGLIDDNDEAVYLLLKRVTVDLDTYRFTTGDPS